MQQESLVLKKSGRKYNPKKPSSFILKWLFIWKTMLLFPIIPITMGHEACFAFYRAGRESGYLNLKLTMQKIFK